MISDRAYDDGAKLEDFLGFRVRQVSSSIRFPPVAACDRDSGLFNVGRLTLPHATAVWKDVLHRAHLSRQLYAVHRLDSGDAGLLAMALNAAPKSHAVRATLMLAELARTRHPVCSASSARAALADILRTGGEARRIAAGHLGEHSPVLIHLHQQQSHILSALLGRVKLSKSNQLVRDIQAEAHACLQAALLISVKVLGRSHPATRSLQVEIGDLQARAGDHDEAIRSWQEALKTCDRADVQSARLLVQTARALQAKGDLEQALQAAQHARQWLEEERSGLAADKDELLLHDASLALTAELAVAILANGQPVETAIDHHHFWSADMLRLVQLAADCHEALFERMRAHPDRMDGQDLINLLRKLISLRLRLARPSQKPLIQAACRRPVTESDRTRAKDVILRMVTASSASAFVERCLEAAELGPTGGGMDELALLCIIANAQP